MIPRFFSCSVPECGRPNVRGLVAAIAVTATLKFLETTAVPAPRAFAYGVCGNGMDHDVGVSFLRMEELPGRPWVGQGVSGGNATKQENTKIWNGLADIMAELEKHPFPKAGSLCCQSSKIEVSAMASDRFIVPDLEGPFDTAVAYHSAYAEQYLSLIADGQLYIEYPVDAYLVYRFLKDNAAQLVEQGAKGQAPGQFFLKHADDKGDHLLVDENLNITGIIDWQMARIVPRREAFGPSLVTAEMNALCGGRVSLSDDDTVLADALKTRGVDGGATDEKARRFFWGLALEPKWEYALPLADARLEVFGVGQEWMVWREVALREYEADERLQALVRDYSRREQE
ncbi:hypothetical protein PT974_12123 [Cladobotryum mycophilum]|uniref:Aminoglycoside phosphotransferase domain-containing protein n=1 Tax=Cladobotryum mycophilum TaxID=491253 RepID=A0ABR0S746_9HYPO